MRLMDISIHDTFIEIGGVRVWPPSLALILALLAAMVVVIAATVAVMMFVKQLKDGACY